MEDKLEVDMVTEYLKAKEEAKQNYQKITVDMIDVYEKAKKN